ncbi:MAG: polyribonucleotide nucleotidyltransferase, partial [Candidatus Schekmanbacteria bacterium RBG_13_48_7]
FDQNPEWKDDEVVVFYVKNEYENLIKKTVRDLALKKQVRIDGRNFDEIRNINIDVGFLPRTHGSSLFTRGETQSLAVLTLGTVSDEQRVDDVLGETSKSFMLHYNFPPFSVGEAKFMRAPGRREIGHGNLAERAIVPIIPQNSVFPYTIRIVSDILESNGSSSMATVCGATLSLMDAGVPIKAPVAGIAMGLVAEDGEFVVFSDIIGLEDHVGDMDFKVAGSKKGITAIQMDLKIAGISMDIIRKALKQAYEGRLHILGKMESALPEPRASLPEHAPRIIIVEVPKEKIGEVIGPGGKTIRGIIEQTGVEKIDISDEDGKVYILSNDAESAAHAEKIVRSLTEEAVIGKTYMGTVKRIEDYGAFIEILPGKDGLLHV